MKRFFLFLLIWPAALMLHGQTETLAPVNDVLVYRGMARLTHTASVTLPAGTQTLIIHGLSPRMLRESFRIEGVGNADIVHMEFRKNFLITPKDKARIQKLKTQIDQLESKIIAIKAREQALKTEQGFIKNNLKLDKNSGLTTVQQISSYYKKRTEAIYKELFRLKKEAEPLEKELEKLKQQLNELQNKGNRNTYDAVITLSVTRAGKFNFRLSYLANGASWTPVYTVRSSGSGADLHWDYKAEISQNTGLDWENIPVSLSSYQPRYRMHLPHVNPWYLRIIKNEMYAESAPRAMKMEKSMAVSVAMDNADVDQVNTTFQVEYKPMVHYTVLSGGKPVLAHLDSFVTQAEYTYFTAPYADKNVYLRARVKDLSSRRLVPGKARIYFEGVYTGEVFINPTDKNTHTDLALGIDPEITVDRKLDKRFDDYNLLGNKVTIKKGYTITVTNHKNIPVHIIVQDRFPVSQDEHIKVKNKETDGTVNSKGIITWDRNIPAGQKTEMYFRFQVQYPKNMQVSGI